MQFQLLFQLFCGESEIYTKTYNVCNSVLAEILSWHVKCEAGMLSACHVRQYYFCVA